MFTQLDSKRQSESQEVIEVKSFSLSALLSFSCSPRRVLEWIKSGILVLVIQIFTDAVNACNNGRQISTANGSSVSCFTNKNSKRWIMLRLRKKILERCLTNIFVKHLMESGSRVVTTIISEDSFRNVIKKFSCSLFTKQTYID